MIKNCKMLNVVYWIRIIRFLFIISHFFILKNKLFFYKTNNFLYGNITKCEKVEFLIVEYDILYIGF